MRVKPTVSPTVKKYKVSVCVVSYNQEKYIGRCLESIINQKTTFDFEIIVGDDNSTDRTREIIREIAENSGDQIRFIFQDRNIGAAFNYAQTHGLATGEYVAHMDGDDLMLPGKLQKQVDIFSKNPACIMVTHDMCTINGEGEITRRSFKKHKAGENTLLDLYETLPFFAHSSKMVARDLELKLLPCIELNTVDIELHTQMAEHGNIYHIDEVLGAYRTGVGITSSKSKSVNPALVEGTKRIFKSALEKHPEHTKIIKKSYARAMLNYAYQAALLENKKQLAEYAKKSKEIYPLSIIQAVFAKAPSFIVFAIVKLRSKLRYKNTKHEQQ